MLTFILNDAQQKQYNDFQKKHRDCYKDKRGKLLRSLIGNTFSIIFTPTGIGNIIGVKCNSCGEEIDLTDYDTW